MTDVKRIIVVSIIAVLSIFPQTGIRAQPTIGSSSYDDVCSKLEEESEFQEVENTRLRSLLESERQTIMTQENVSYSQAEDIQRLNQKLENKQQKIDKLENVSNEQTVENQRLNLALENKQHEIETLKNVSSYRAEEILHLNMELENKQQKIETLENESSSLVEENHQLNMELEIKQQRLETLENVSYTQAEENHQLNMELENKQQKIETLENVSSSQVEENHQLNMELEIKRQRIETLGNVSNITAEEIHRLNLELEYKQRKIEALENERRRLRTLGIQSVTATFIGSFDHNQNRFGITKVEDKIYVMDGYPNRIKVYEDLIGYRFIRYIALSGTSWPTDIVYSNKSKCVYISDFLGAWGRIWVMTTTGENRLTIWLNYTDGSNTLSLSNEGQLLVLRRQSFSQDSLEIYSLDATLIRRIRLPQDMKYTMHVVQTPEGNFIISHHLNNTLGESWVISKVTNDGQLIHRFIPRNQSEEIKRPYHLSLDPDNNRLFVTDRDNNRVILFDSHTLTWSQVILSQETNGIRKPVSLFYDVTKKHLFVSQSNVKSTVYEIN